MESHAPFLTWRFDAALQFASALHHKQIRKSTSIPYIAHLMSVCALVLEAGGNEDQAIAALLHDAVEDQGGQSTLDTIGHLFGETVADAVKSCSDSMVSDPIKKLPWRERKEAYLAHLRGANQDAVLIAAAEKLHNARTILSDYRDIGERLWLRFNAPKSDQLWFYGEFVKSIRQTAAPKILVDELERVVNELNELARSSPKAGHIVDVTSEYLGKAFIITGQTKP
jgi:(p)ppGpp synthase/HD superfamily hydrolase